MRTQANGVAVPAAPAPAGDRSRPDRQLAAVGEVPHPALPLPQRRRRAYGALRDAARPRPRARRRPATRRALGHDDEYLLGPDLLVAPVLDPGARERGVYLPPGRWIDLWRSARYRERRGDLALGRAAVLRGSAAVDACPPRSTSCRCSCAPERRSRCSIPSVDSLARYGDAADGVVALAERRRRMRLLAFPRGRSVSAVPGAASGASRPSAAASGGCGSPAGAGAPTPPGVVRGDAQAVRPLLGERRRPRAAARRWEYDARRRASCGRGSRGRRRRASRQRAGEVAPEQLAARRVVEEPRELELAARLPRGPRPGPGPRRRRASGRGSRTARRRGPPRSAARGGAARPRRGPSGRRPRRAGGASARRGRPRRAGAAGLSGASVSGGSVSEAVAISTGPGSSANSGASQGRSRRPETITISGSGAQAVALAQLALRRVADDAPVVLGPHRPGADHHRVDARPQGDQHRGVGVGPDRPGAAADRRPAVEREDEVGDQVGAVGRRERSEVERRRLLERGRLAGSGSRRRTGGCFTATRSRQVVDVGAVVGIGLGAPANHASRISPSSAAEVVRRLSARQLASFQRRPRSR